MTERVTSRQNALLKRVAALGGKPQARAEAGQFLCDGPKLLTDALRSGVVPLVVVSADGTEVPALPSATRHISVPPALLDSLSPLDTPQGVLFVCALPPPPEALGPRGSYVLLDRVQDPKNVGAILRSAEAFGLTGVLLLPGSADPFGPKAVRASMGAVFRMPAAFTELSRVVSSPLPLWAAATGGEDIRDVPRGPCIVAIGSEGRGLSPDVLSAADRLVGIPMPGGAESLNAAVAAGILLWELTRTS